MSLFRRRLMMAGSSRSVETLLISLDTNQDDDSVLIGKRITVSYGVTEKILEWKGQTISIDIPGETVCSIFFPAVDGYKTPEALSFTTVGETTKAISGMYNTEVVKVKAIFSNGGVITGQPVNINGKLVTTNLSGIATSMVPYGKMYDIIPGAKPDYDTPDSIIGRTASQKEYSTTFTYIETSSRQEVVDIDLKTNQASSSDINGVNINLKYGEVNKNLTWRGSRLTEVVPEGEIYTLTFSGVKDYKTPNQQSYTAVGGNTRPVQALYETEVVEVTVSADDGAPIAGQVVTINGETHSVGSSGIVRQKVAFGISYSVSMSAKQGYTTPGLQTYTSSQALRPVTMTYRVESAGEETVNVTLRTNQEDQSLLNGINVNVEYSGRPHRKIWNGSVLSFTVPGGTPYSVQVDKLENYRTPDRLDIPSASGGFTRPVTMEYKAEKVEIRIKGDVSTFEPSGLRVDVVKSDGYRETVYVKGRFATFYVPFGVEYTAAPQDLIGYQTPEPFRSVADSVIKKADLMYVSYAMKLKIIAKLDDGSPAYLHTFHMNDKTYRLDVHGEMVLSIDKEDKGKTFNIVMDEVPGYITPDAQTYVADKPYTELNFVFVKEVIPKSGVWILGSNKQYVKSSNWNPGQGVKAVGVAVFDHNFKLLIGNMVVGNKWKSFNGPGTISGVMTADTYSSAMSDLNGASNTDKILTYDSDRMAARICREHDFGEGKTGYLPAYGQIIQVFNYGSSVASAYSKAFGKSLNNAVFWSSTQAPGENAWVFEWGTGKGRSMYKGDNSNCIPFCSL